MSSVDSEYERTPEQRRQAVASILAMGVIRVLYRKLQMSQIVSQSASKRVDACDTSLDDS